jgi:hypothetical protein
MDGTPGVQLEQGTNKDGEVGRTGDTIGRRKVIRNVEFVVADTRGPPDGCRLEAGNLVGSTRLKAPFGVGSRSPRPRRLPAGGSA